MVALVVRQGDSVRTCQGDRTWSGTSPVCVASPEQSCGPPPAVENAQVQTDPDGVSYACDAGLRLVGPRTLSCLANGTWSQPAPSCQRTLRPLRLGPPSRPSRTR